MRDAHVQAAARVVVPAVLPRRSGLAPAALGPWLLAACALVLLGADATRLDELAIYGAIERWLEPWMPWLTVSLVASSLVALVTVVHAFVRGRPLWGIATLLLGVTAPAYLLKHMTFLRPELRVLALLALLSPLAVLAALFISAIVNPPVL